MKKSKKKDNISLEHSRAIENNTKSSKLIYHKNWEAWFNASTAYLDPNDWGDAGYALLTILLITFDRVVVHSPLGLRMEYAATASPLSDYHQSLVINWKDLRDLVLETDPLTGYPPIIVTAFDTYLDPKYDLKHYEGLGLRPENKDNDRFLPQSSFFKAVRLLTDTRAENAEIALNLANDDNFVKEAEERLHRPMSLAGKYVDAFLRTGFRPPRALEKEWPILKDPQRYVALAAYDFLNDEHAAFGGGANLRCPTADGLTAAEFLGKRQPIILAKEHTSLTSEDVATYLKLIAREFSKEGLVKIDAKYILELRKERPHFLKSLGELFFSLEQVPNKRWREIEAVKWARKALDIAAPKTVKALIYVLEVLSNTMPQGGEIIQPALENVFKWLEKEATLRASRDEDRWKYLVKASRQVPKWSKREDTE